MNNEKILKIQKNPLLFTVVFHSRGSLRSKHTEGAHGLCRNAAPLYVKNCRPTSTRTNHPWKQKSSYNSFGGWLTKKGTLVFI